MTDHERARHDAEWVVFRAAFDRFQKFAPMGDWRDFQRWATRTAAGRESLVAWRRARATLALTEAKLRVVGTLLAQHADTRSGELPQEAHILKFKKRVDVRDVLTIIEGEGHG